MVETKRAEVIRDPEGLIRIKFKPLAEITLEDVKEMFSARIELSGNKKHATLIDLGTIKSVSQDARQFGARNEVNNLTSALALIIKSPISKVIGNFFVGLNKPQYPTKLFTCEDNAVEWLKEFRT